MTQIRTAVNRIQNKNLKCELSNLNSMQPFQFADGSECVTYDNKESGFYSIGLGYFTIPIYMSYLQFC